MHRLLLPLGAALAALARLRLSPASSAPAAPDEPTATRTRWVDLCWNAGIMALALYLLWRVTSYVSAGVSWRDVGEVLMLGGITLLRVTVLIALSSLLWVPLGILIGLRPKWAQAVQPLAQFLAAFPANLLFPVFVIGIAHWHLNPDVWLSPLIVLGTQWYILFNVIAGASAYPNDYREVAANFGIRGWQWWRRCMLPAVFPYYVTGAITASGGAWNGETARASGEKPIFQQIPQDRRAIAPADFFAFRIVAAVIRNADFVNAIAFQRDFDRKFRLKANPLLLEADFF